MELGGVSFIRVGGAVCWGQGVSVHHRLSGLLRVLDARGGSSKTSNPGSTTAPGSWGLYAALRFACGPGTGG